jgi:hypothetical protein
MELANTPTRIKAMIVEIRTHRGILDSTRRRGARSSSDALGRDIVSVK